MTNHNFKEVAGTKRMDSDRAVRQLWCQACDSIVEYDLRVSVREINKRLTNDKFLCIPPIGVNK